MTAITFDTLSIARRLESSGLQKAQAEAIAGELRTAGESDTDHLTTKEELNSFKSEMRSDFLLIRSEMREMEARLKVHLGTMIFGLGGVLVTIKFFTH